MYDFGKIIVTVVVTAIIITIYILPQSESPITFGLLGHIWPTQHWLEKPSSFVYSEQVS